jgi:catechol-2,3-dioxygenase
VLHLITPKDGDGRSSQKSSFDHVAFKTAKYQDVLKKLKSLNIPFEEKPIPDMTAHQIFLRDPAGNRVELNFDGDKD